MDLYREVNALDLETDMYTVKWVFSNGHEWTKDFHSAEARQSFTERCYLLTNRDIVSVVYLHNDTNEEKIK